MLLKLKLLLLLLLHPAQQPLSSCSPTVRAINRVGLKTKFVDTCEADINNKQLEINLQQLNMITRFPASFFTYELIDMEYLIMLCKIVFQLKFCEGNGTELGCRRLVRVERDPCNDEGSPQDRAQ